MDPHLAAMRRSYAGAGLAEEDLAATWCEQLRRWLREAEDAGVPEPNAMVLATVGEDGPSARTVLLKDLDDDGLVFFTNLRSRKGRELAALARAAVVFPWIPLGRQVTVRGEVQPLPEADSDAYFASRPHGAQLGAQASPQSQVITGREELDALHAELEARYPPDVPVPRPAHWGGLRIVPWEVEFWQGRPDRLHDRLRFRREGGSAWVVERLAP